ncbi:MAG: hypothetical protein C9356_11350 [Oleiphilus sp.]|nr:MAG: hypothetical protein C9356_11350 [Oleiphilus sp.]
MRPSSHLKTLVEDSHVAQDDNWMLSYIDVFVLITTLFLMLLVMNRSSFGTTDMLEKPPAHFPESQIPLPAISESPALLSQDIIPVSKPYQPLDAPGSESSLALYTNLKSAIETHGLDNHIQLARESNRTRLEIQSRVLFDSGDAFLTRPGEAVLEKLLPLLETVEGEIVIEGHTDNQPISTRRFPSNWSLAAARATEVLQFFVTEGLDQDRFRAVSYGDTRPITGNTTENERSKNRRVTLVLETRSTSPDSYEVSL